MVELPEGKSWPTSKEGGLELYITGQWRGEKWELQGIYDSFELACENCPTDMYFAMGPFKLNEPLPDDPCDAPMNCFPQREK